MLEGYGITECSPVVSVNRPGRPPCGVGLPLKGTEIKIVHPETHDLQPPGTPGLILVRGPSVFAGYIGLDANPFVEMDGQRWYNTGDIGVMEGESLVITGRLKRFVKIGGEMVSMGAIEETLCAKWPAEDGAQNFAVVSLGTEGGERPTLIVLTTTKISLEQANEALQAAGFPHLVRLSRVKKISEMPLLGSGKIDMQSVKAMAA